MDGESRLRNLRSALVGPATVLACFLAGCSQGRSGMTLDPATDHWPRPFTRVVVLGESTVEGGGWIPNQADRYADVLVALINRVQAEPVEYLNCGIGASVISPSSAGYEASRKPSALERYEKEVIGADPDLFVLAYGLNDMRAGMDVDTFIADMDTIVRNVQSACKPLIVLVNVYHMTGYEAYPPFDRGGVEATARYNEAIRELAEETGCLYADVYDAEGRADWVVHSDGVHANSVGNLLIAHKIFEVLATNCAGLSEATRARDGDTKWTESTCQTRARDEAAKSKQKP